MADSQCSTDPAHGVEITDHWPNRLIYFGDETALIAAGVIRSEWVAGLGEHSRKIVLEPDGGFTVIREGVNGNYVTHALRNRGLFSLRREKDGRLRVIKYRTLEEERLKKREREEERQKEREREAEEAKNMVKRAGISDDERALLRMIREMGLTPKQVMAIVEEMQRRQVAASACLHVGDRVLYFGPTDEYGHEATIDEGYQMFAVEDGDGPYIDRDGKRLEYRYGYTIKFKGSDIRHFVPAHSITRDDCKPAHLRLAYSRRAASMTRATRMRPI